MRSNRRRRGEREAGRSLRLTRGASATRSKRLESLSVIAAAVPAPPDGVLILDRRSGCLSRHAGHPRLAVRCVARQRFDPVQIWGGPLPSPLPEGWRQNAAVREVVEFAANPENPPGQGAERITAFAAPLGAAREEQLMMVFAGLLEQFDLLRRFVIEGVRDFVLRAKILRDAVAQNDAALAALPADGGARVGAPSLRPSAVARCAEHG
jgi:hypothetical protein